MYKTTKKGFTLVEILVVMAIIGVLASAVMASLSAARTKTRNVKRLQTMAQYEVALNSVLDETGGYPTTGTANANYCLGDYSDDRCWTNGTGYSESATLNAFLQKYISPLPTWEGSVAGVEGAVYNCSIVSGTRCVSIDIHWFMEGDNAACGKGVDVTATYIPSELGQGVTRCRYIRNI